MQKLNNDLMNFKKFQAIARHLRADDGVLHGGKYLAYVSSKGGVYTINPDYPAGARWRYTATPSTLFWLDDVTGASVHETGVELRESNNLRSWLTPKPCGAIVDPFITSYHDDSYTAGVFGVPELVRAAALLPVVKDEQRGSAYAYIKDGRAYAFDEVGAICLMSEIETGATALRSAVLKSTGAVPLWALRYLDAPSAKASLMAEKSAPLGNAKAAMVKDSDVFVVVPCRAEFPYAQAATEKIRREMTTAPAIASMCCTDLRDALNTLSSYVPNRDMNSVNLRLAPFDCAVGVDKMLAGFEADADSEYSALFAPERLTLLADVFGAQTAQIWGNADALVCENEDGSIGVLLMTMKKE